MAAQNLLVNHSILMQGRNKPCSHCTHFGGLIAGGAHAWCLQAKQVQANPKAGCAYWQREPGTDDGPSPMWTRESDSN